MFATEARLQLQLIGRFALADGLGAPIVLSSRRARGLLAYLLLQPHQTEVRGKLCGLFWSDRGEAQARASLRQCLSELRAALPESSRHCVIVDRETVRLHPEAVATDTSALIDASREGCGDALGDLLKRAGASRLLEDVELAGLFAEWLEVARSQFDRELAHGVRSWILKAESERDWTALRDVAGAYLLRDPVDEIVAAALIRAATALGDISSARRRFESLRVALGQAFGVVPGAEAVAALNFTPGQGALPRQRSPGRPAVRSPAIATPGRPLVMIADIDSSHLEGEGRSLGSILKSEILAGLSAFRDFQVTSAAENPEEREGGEWLQRGPGYILGGNIWRSSNGLRFTAHLTRAFDRRVIWSERIEVSYAQVTEAVDRIIIKIIGAVSPVIEADLEHGGTTGLDSQYTRYVAARAAAAAPTTFEQAKSAAADLEALIADDPTFILPYLPLARLYNTDFAFTRPLSSGATERSRAFTLAKAALGRDRGYIYAYTLVGWCHLRQSRWDAARTHFEQALALNPFHPDRVMEVGFGFLFLGDVARARELLQRSLLLNPTPKDIYYIDLAFLETIDGNHDQSSSYLDLVTELTTWGLLYKAMNATLSGSPSQELNEAFLQHAKALWDPNKSFTPDGVLKWAANDHPLAPETLRKRFLDSVHQTLF